MAIPIRTLRYFLRDAVAAYTEDVELLEPANPMVVSMNDASYSVHILSITDSGEGRENDDEQRIQIRRGTRKEQQRRQRAGTTPLFIGFFEEGDAFTAWDPEHVFSLKAKNGSAYAFLEHRFEALRDGCAVHRFKPKYLERKASTIALPSEQLGFYLENWRALHDATSKGQLAQALSDSADALEAGQSSVKVRVGGRRRKVQITRTAFPRDPEFTRQVLAAYGHACCICGKQLSLVQAAHIIPHSRDDSSNAVENGVALCVEHHKLYDDGLILKRARGAIKINRNRVEHLRNVGQDRGLASVEKLDGRRIRMPRDAASRPDDQLLVRGARIRASGGA